MLALNYFYVGDYRRTIDLLNPLPKTYDVLIDLGAALFEIGDPAGAAGHWKRAIEVNPAGTEAYFNMGYAGLTSNDPAGAAQNLAILLRLQPRDAEALFLLAQAQERLGRTLEAQKAMAEAAGLSSRIERFRNQSLPKLQRLRSVPVIREIVWTAQRIARRDRQ
jgi:tetratricopeptide (TPR) repeat protein